MLSPGKRRSNFALVICFILDLLIVIFVFDYISPYILSHHQRLRLAIYIYMLIIYIDTESKISKLVLGTELSGLDESTYLVLVWSRP